MKDFKLSYDIARVMPPEVSKAYRIIDQWQKELPRLLEDLRQK